MNKSIRKSLSMAMVVALASTQFLGVYAGTAPQSGTTPPLPKEIIMQKAEGAAGKAADLSHDALAMDLSAFEEAEALKKQQNTALEVQALTNPQTEIQINSTPEEGDSIVPGKIIVKYKDPTKNAEINALELGIQSVSIEEVNALGVAEVTVSKATDVMATVKTLNENPDIEYAEPVYIRSISAEPAPINSSNCSDTAYINGWQWGLQALGLDPLWAVTDKAALSNTVIAVIDTGVDNESLETKNYLVPGYDFVNNDNNADDDHGHGTHVAGISAGAWDGKGIAGVAGGAKIMPIKVLDDGGNGNTVDIINGIIFAVNNGANVINMSLGGGAYSRAEEEAIQYAIDHDVIVVAAAGNDGSNNVNYPARYAGVISVGAAEWTGMGYTLAGFSNFGADIDVVAPGVNILSCVPSELDNPVMSGDFDSDGYSQKSGTSMASPFVAGMAALIKANNPTMNCDEVLKKMQDTGYEFPGADGLKYKLIDGNSGMISPPFIDKHVVVGIAPGITAKDRIISLDAVETLGGAKSVTATGKFNIFRAKVVYRFDKITDISGVEKIGEIQLLNGQMVAPVTTQLPDQDGIYVFYAQQAGQYYGSSAEDRIPADNDGNTSFGTAIDLELGKEFSAKLDAYGDNDYYRVTVPAGEKYQVRTTGDIDMFGFAYSNEAVPAQLAYNDDSGKGLNFLFNINGPGTYYIKATGFRSSLTGSYGIVLDYPQKIHGKIQFPEGLTSNTDTVVKFYIAGFDGESYTRFNPKSITIPADSNSAEYQLAFGLDISYDLEYQLSYYVPAFKDSSTIYTPTGFFKSSGTVLNKDECELLPDVNQTGVDFTLVKKADTKDVPDTVINLGQTLKNHSDYCFDMDGYELNITEAGSYTVSYEFEDDPDVNRFMDLYFMDEEGVLTKSPESFPSVLDNNGYNGAGDGTTIITKSYSVAPPPPGCKYIVRGYADSIYFNEYDSSFSFSRLGIVAGQVTKNLSNVPKTGYICADRNDGKCFYWYYSTVAPTFNYLMPLPYGNYTLRYLNTDTNGVYADEAYYSRIAPSGMVYGYQNATPFNFQAGGGAPPSFPGQPTPPPMPFLTASINLTMISASEVPDPESDDKANAKEIALAVIEKGTVNPYSTPKDEDFFKFTAPYAGNYDISFSSDDSNLGVYLYDGTANQWVQYNESLRGNGNVLTRHLNPGLHYIKVFGITRSGEYEFVVNAAPTAKTVEITGIVKVGETLTGNYKYTPAVPSKVEKDSTFRWLKSDTSAGTYAPIAGAVSKTYTLTAADQGKYIKFEVTPKSSTDPITGDAVQSVAAGPVVALGTGSGNTGGGGGGGGGGNTPPAKVTTPSVVPVIAIPKEPVPLAGVFSDAVGHWAANDISKLAGLGFVGGYPDGTVHPDTFITRAEAAKILVGATGKKPLVGEPREALADSGSLPAWAKGYVGTALDEKIVTGFEDKTFRAGENMTRDQMVAMVMRAFGLGQSDKPLTFADKDTVQTWCKGYISKAVELGLVKGYASDNTFRPSQNVTRAEFFTVIARCLELKKQ